MYYILKTHQYQYFYPSYRIIRHKQSIKITKYVTQSFLVLKNRNSFVVYSPKFLKQLTGGYNSKRIYQCASTR